MFAWIAGVVTRALEWTRIVWPSGSDLATALVPTVVPPPSRLSMRMVWPTWADTCSNTVRGTMSVALPGAYGTITRTVFVGQVCAHAGAASASAEQAIAISRASVLIDVLRDSSSPIRPTHERPAQETALFEAGQLATIVVRHAAVERIHLEAALEIPAALGRAAAPAGIAGEDCRRPLRQCAQRERHAIGRRRSVPRPVPVGSRRRRHSGQRDRQAEIDRLHAGERGHW